MKTSPPSQSVVADLDEIVRRTWLAHYYENVSFTNAVRQACLDYGEVTADWLRRQVGELAVKLAESSIAIAELRQQISDTNRIMEGVNQQNRDLRRQLDTVNRSMAQRIKEQAEADNDYPCPICGGENETKHDRSCPAWQSAHQDVDERSSKRKFQKHGKDAK